MYTVTLSDGSKIENLTMNGNNFVSKSKLTEEMFTNKLSKVTVNDGKTNTEYGNMVLVQVTQMGDECWFILRKKTKEEKLIDAISAIGSSVTDVQVALAEVYEMILGGN